MTPNGPARAVAEHLDGTAALLRGFLATPAQPSLRLPAAAAAEPAAAKPAARIRRARRA